MRVVSIYGSYSFAAIARFMRAKLGVHAPGAPSGVVVVSQKRHHYVILSLVHVISDDDLYL